MLCGRPPGDWPLRDNGVSMRDMRSVIRDAVPGPGRALWAQAPGLGCRRRPGTANLALRARRVAELVAIAAREMRRGLEAAGGGHVHDRHRRLQQQFARPAQPHLEVIALRHAVEVAPEEALDLPARQPGGAGDA